MPEHLYLRYYKTDSMGKKQLLAAGLFISFFFGYLEWGVDNCAFIYEGFLEVIYNTKGAKSNFTHPLILLPLIGEIIFLFGSISKSLNYKWYVAALIFTGLLYIMIILVGFLSMKVKILFSAIPYLFFAVAMIRALRKEYLSMVK